MTLGRLDRFALWLLPVAILIVTWLGPAEQTLGETARIIYLHGALVWVAMLTFGTAALLAILGLVDGSDRWPRWSQAAGQVALLFWVAYLPLSMWAARAAWGRVFLQDPSFQRAFRVLAVAVIVQVAIWLVNRPSRLVSALNLIPFAFLLLQLAGAEQLMHPQGPIRNAESRLIQVYFYGLSALCGTLAWAIGRRLLSRRQRNPAS